METPLENRAEETNRLQRCMNDLASLLALPATWYGADSSQIAGSLLDTLLGMLRVDFVFLRLSEPDAKAVSELVRLAPSVAQLTSREVSAALDRSRTRMRIGDADLGIASARLGLQGEIGVIAAGSRRPDFPTEIEKLVLDVAANQVALALQGARASGEQTRAAGVIDERVAQRTGELAAANEKLRQEIAACRQAEAALRNSERDSRLIVDSIPGLVAVFAPGGEVEFVNRQILEYYGKTLEELKGWAANDVVHPDDRARAVAIFTQAIASGKPFDFEVRARRFDGAFRWFQSRGFPLHDAAGQVVRWYNLLIDIDERKRAEEALRRSEARLSEAERELQLTIDTIPAFVTMFRPDGEREYVNKTWRDNTGLQVADIQDGGWTRIVHPDDQERSERLWRDALATGEPIQIEQRIRRHDGQYRWHMGRRAPLRDDSGNILRWYSVAIDIEDQKQAETALRQSETRLAATERELRLTLNSIPTITWRSGPNGHVQDINKRWFEYTGTTPEQVQGHRWRSCIHPDDVVALVATGDQAILIGQPVDAEARLRRHDGEYRWFLFRMAPARDESGNVVAWYGIITDIEDRKRAEEALQQSRTQLAATEREMRVTLDSIPTITWRGGPNGYVQSLNKRWFEYTGTTPAQMRGAGWKSCVHPDDLEQLVDHGRQYVASGTPIDGEARLRRDDGEYRWFLFRPAPARDEAGNIVAWYGSITNIHDRKHAEEELRRSETLLAEGQRLSSTGTFSWHVDTNVATFSQELNRIFEFEPNIFVTLGRLRARIHPDDRALMDEAVTAVRAGREISELDIRLRMEDDRIKYLRVLGRAIRRQDGGPEFLGAIQDVTQRRAAEAALDKVRSELAHVTRVMSLGALTASIAHEVNQPLAGIITNAGTCLRMLAADPPNIDGARETARRTIRDGNRAADVITRLRALFSKKPLTSETMDLNAATREVVALVFSDLLRNRVILRVELDDEPLLVTGDRVQLQQVILNLVRNAADAMKDVNDRPRNLLVKTDREDEDGARLIVKDAGVGFEPQSVERIFDAFYTTKTSGMGIGLSVSRSIIEGHGGRLWAEANDGPGATFAFSIPRQAANAGGEGTAGAILTRPTRGARDAARNTEW